MSDAINVTLKGYTKELVDAALAAIDRVHDDGVLPQIDLKSSNKNSFGYFQPKPGANGIEADHMGVRVTGSWPALTAAHETGHFLDLEAIGAKGNYATVTGGDMAAVLKAAEETDGIKAIRERLANGIEERECRYLLKPQEIWARAYAQFVTEESGNLTLKGDLAKLLADPGYRQRQWSAGDFAPVSTAIKELFKKLGWL